MSNFIFSRSFIPGRGPWGNKSTNTNQTEKQTPWDGLRDGTAGGARVWGDDRNEQFEIPGRHKRCIRKETQWEAAALEGIQGCDN